MSPIATPAQLPDDVVAVLKDAYARAKQGQSDGASFLSNNSQIVKKVEAVAAEYGVDLTVQ